MAYHQVALYEGLVYGILLIVGGVVGYTKARSKPSLYAGATSGVLAIIFSYLGFSGNELLALFLLAAESILLSAFFYMRYSSSKKFMPAGFMVIVSAVSLVIYLTGILVA
jgi:uncharacterized membrane protein (UPF0136 family)